MVFFQPRRLSSETEAGSSIFPGVNRRLRRTRKLKAPRGRPKHSESVDARKFHGSPSLAGKSWTKKGGQIWDFYMKKYVFYMCQYLFLSWMVFCEAFCWGYLGRFIDFWSMFLMNLDFGTAWLKIPLIFHGMNGIWDPTTWKLDSDSPFFCFGPSALQPTPWGTEYSKTSPQRRHQGNPNAPKSDLWHHFPRPLQVTHQWHGLVVDRPIFFSEKSPRFWKLVSNNFITMLSHLQNVPLACSLRLYWSTSQTKRISQQVSHLSRPSAPVKVLGKAIACIAHDLRSTVRDVPGNFWWKKSTTDGSLRISSSSVSHGHKT